MTIEQMNDCIQNYCDDRDCCNCVISKQCDNCYGVFEKNYKTCQEAYDLLPHEWKCPEQKEDTTATDEVVNHPSHYNREGAMECIDEMILVFGVEAVKNFCLCNWLKYRYRASDKNGEEDLKKSDWYLKKYKELCNGTTNKSC